MANEVKLTFAGDADSLERAAQRASRATEDMADTVDRSSRRVEDAGAGFDKVADGFDNAETKAMGFRDTLTGVQDGMRGVGGLLRGDFSAENFLTLGAGVGDLASGFANFLIPSLKNAVTWMGNTRVGMLAQAAAAKVVTAGQWLLNVAMSANPIGLIVIAIIALIAIFVLLWVKCEGFRNFFIGVWEAIVAAAKAVADWFMDTLWPTIKGFFDFWWDLVQAYFNFWKAVWQGIADAASAAWDWVKDKALAVWNWFAGLPERFRDTFNRVKDFIINAFKAAFNAVSNLWNNTVGKLSWSVPSWVPFIGGNTISAPQLPTFHQGGIVPGAVGQEVLAVLQAGERVIPVSEASSSGGDTYNITVNGSKFRDGSDFEGWLSNLRNNRRRGLVTA